MEKNEIRPKRKRLRSPGYPLINLSEAIDKAKILWDKDKTNHIPKDSALEHMEYQPGGGYGLRVLAALKQFGLIVDSQGDIILTQDAIDLAIHERESQDYINIVKELALKPTIYAKIYNDNNGTIPSDATLKIKLIKDYGFNPDKITGFINNFRSTILFANLSETEDIEDVESTTEVGSIQEVDVFQQGANVMDTATTSRKIENITPKGMETFPIPLSKGKKAALVFESLPVDKKDIEVIKKWLELYEDNLTERQEID